MLDPDAPLESLRGIGPVRAASLSAAGLERVGDLLQVVPSRYEDRRRAAAIGEIAEAGEVVIEGRLRGLRRVPGRRGRRATIVGRVDDGSGELAVMWFNAPYLLRQLSAGERYRFHGRVARGSRGWSLRHPGFAPLGQPGGPRDSEGVVPIYAARGGVGSRLLKRLLGDLLARFDPRRLPDPIPMELLERRRLPTLGESIRALHAPGAGADLVALNGFATPHHQRLVYGELLEHQLAVIATRRVARRAPKPHRYRLAGGLVDRLAAALPFRLTAAQRRAIDEIVGDLGRPHAMRRLLHGDVGSGKTVVAGLALAAAGESGLQGALMAPTEILAQQHHRTLIELFGDRFGGVLVTASQGRGEAERAAIASGAARLVVGTHALFQDRLRFADLGLVIVDEQQRFGVAQRRRLLRKGAGPDLLVMTATPIPRSLALTVYGDLDVSALDELPPGRRPVETRLVPRRERTRVYRELQARLVAGEQAYVVFPAIEGEEGSMSAAVETLGRRVQRTLAGHPTGRLHARMRWAEREEVLRDFAAGRLRAILATTVIEVGLDVPTASLMIIEGAERFGLAQLHQLRGRVGRGERRSTCLAIHGPLTTTARLRLEAFASTVDGFRLAEEDLRLRGPGDLVGTRQAGLPAFRYADLRRDLGWLTLARLDAGPLATEIEAGRHGGLRRRLERRRAAAEASDDG